ncbi:hypothetical protein ACSSNL_08830 [Thalassobius sp. S69A]|uniref:hypothetical protein n=1 Tax=unclassified Thalassovita TaxID=2619711 RepID=UPI003C7B15BB
MTDFAYLERHVGNSPIETFELKIERVDITTEGDDAWAPEFVKTMKDAGFTMKGGFYVQLRAESQSNEELLMFSYVPVAKRFIPREREPNSFAEGLTPKFMEYCCFKDGRGELTDWGAGVVNSIIATNYGQVPEEWLSAGMADLDTSEVTH